jgi:tRNA pseudouridine13 synthase
MNYDRDPHVIPRTYLSAAIPGIGGQIKVRHEDFLVDELPAYQPQGSGEHIYVLVEKRNLSTMDAVAVVARHFGVKKSAIGYAGLKDKRAITRQVISIHTPGKKPEDFPLLEHPAINILWADLHANKLRIGHLQGNRFSIRIRGVEPAAVIHAKKTLDLLARTGVPNRFGEQRFGFMGNNHVVARHIIAGDPKAAVDELLGPSAAKPEHNAEARALYAQGKFADAINFYPRQARTERLLLQLLARGLTPLKAFRALEHSIRSFFFSSFQSAVFNSVLDRRILDNTLGSLQVGDLAMKHVNRAVFAVDDAVAADPETPKRLASFEISPSGPMWGSTMMRAGGATDRVEVEALQNTGLTPEAITAFDAQAEAAGDPKLEGARRPLRVPLIDPDVEGGADEHGPYVRVAFELPRGSFATVVLREIMKPAEPLEDEHEH